MRGRESRRSNDVFFACSLIDYIARKTKNRRADVVEALGRERVAKIIDLADVYHSDNIDAVSDGFIEEAQIPLGTFDNMAAARYAVPTHWDIGHVYKRLVLAAADDEGIDEADAVMRVYRSFVSDLIDNYNGSFYYDSPAAIFDAYKTGEVG